MGWCLCHARIPRYVHASQACTCALPAARLEWPPSSSQSSSHGYAHNSWPSISSILRPPAFTRSIEPSLWTHPATLTARANTAAACSRDPSTCAATAALSTPLWRRPCPNSGMRAATIDRNILSGARVIELGAGPGLPALFAAATGARACITDLSKVVPLIDHNIRANAHAIRHVAPPPPAPPGHHHDAVTAHAASTGAQIQAHPADASAGGGPNCVQLPCERVSVSAPDGRICAEAGVDPDTERGYAEDGAPAAGSAHARASIATPASRDEWKRQRGAHPAPGPPSGGGGRRPHGGGGRERRQRCGPAIRRRSLTCKSVDASQHACV